MLGQRLFLHLLTVIRLPSPVDLAVDSPLMDSRTGSGAGDGPGELLPPRDGECLIARLNDATLFVNHASSLYHDGSQAQPSRAIDK